ncbi:MAG TPA: GTP cyclohydrolase II, partial [Novosphingobium sp.]
MSASRRVALALDAFRHGWPIRIDKALLLLPAETGFAPGVNAPTMLISAARAVTLKLANQREAAVPEAPVLIRGADPFGLPQAQVLADPALDLAHPLKGPFRAEPLPAPHAAATAMELARLAGILPAFLVDPAPADEAQVVASADLAEWKNPAHLTIASRARLPVAAAEEAEIVAFRARDDLREHVALVIGDPNGDRAP